MKPKQVVTFVVSKDLDIENHLIRLHTYKNKLHSNLQSEAKEKIERLLKLSPAQQKKAISKGIDGYYSGPRRKSVASLAADVNNEWIKIEKKFIKRIGEIHKHEFPFTRIKGVLSSAQRFGYHPYSWFATSMFQNKFLAMDTAMHELMHFMFHKYYWKKCSERGLTEKQIWDIKESFTILLNLEFADIRFREDFGYPEHEKIRAAIKKSWLKYRDFEKALASAIACFR